MRGPIPGLQELRASGEALGEGGWDAIRGIMGMLLGAALHAEAFPLLKTTILTRGDFGKITLPRVPGVNHCFVIVPFFAASPTLFAWLEKKEL